MTILVINAPVKKLIRHLPHRVILSIRMKEIVTYLGQIENK